MALPYKVDDLDKVPEGVRDQYEERDGAYVLSVDGVEPEEDVAGLKSALAKLKGQIVDLKKQAGRVSDDDLEELEELRAAAKKREEDKAKAEGRWEDMRARLNEEHSKALDGEREKAERYEKVIERLTVQNELRAAIAEIGTPAQYHEAVEALLSRRGPQVEWDGDNPRGVFPDELHGNQPIGEFVKGWSKTDEAKAFMPVSTKSGGGSGDGEPGGDGKSWQGKKWADMSPEERVEYTDHKYGAGASA